MSYVDINAYNCTCDRCSHTWSTFKLPLTCAKCRSPYWDIPRTSDKPVADFPTENKKNSAASPDKKETIGGLQALMDSIKAGEFKEKPKSVIDTWPTKPPVDQPDYYDTERSVSVYD